MLDMEFSPETVLAGTMLPESTRDSRRRVRVAVHLCLERATSVGQLIGELDELAVWLGQHDDPDGARMLLDVSDMVREEVSR